MTFPVAAGFEERTTGNHVDGEIHPTIWLDIAAQLQWKYGGGALDAEWDWAGIFDGSQTRHSRIECYSAMAGDELHGLISLDIRGRKIGRAKGLVVDYLATNPQNRAGGLKYVGIALMAVAVARSRELKMGGRIWLESLPDPRTLAFYEGIGMTKHSEKSQDGFDAFTFDIDAAAEFFRLVQNEKRIAL